MRWIGLLLLVCVGGAAGQDWSRLGHLKPGTLIQVHSIGDPYGLDDRCRLEAVDPTLLRCIWEGDGVTRMLYPADRVAAVYEVRKPGPGAARWVGLAFATIGVVGLATGNAGAVLVGVVGGLYMLCFEGVHAITSIGHAPPERLKLVYRR